MCVCSNHCLTEYLFRLKTLRLSQHSYSRAIAIDVTVLLESWWQERYGDRVAQSMRERSHDSGFSSRRALVGF